MQYFGFSAVYINRRTIPIKIKLKKVDDMKKSSLLWLCAVLMMVVGMSSCSSDDEFGASGLCHAWYWEDHLDGDRLTCRWDGAEETFTYRIVFEKSGEDSFIMYRYSKGEETPSWHNTYYTSERIDDIYRNTPEYLGEW